MTTSLYLSWKFEITFFSLIWENTCFSSLQASNLCRPEKSWKSVHILAKVISGETKKSINNLMPPILNNLFQSTSKFPSYSARHSLIYIHVPRFRRNVSKLSIKYHAPMVWNNILRNIKYLLFLNLFKVKFKYYLLPCLPQSLLQCFYVL